MPSPAHRHSPALAVPSARSLLPLLVGASKGAVKALHFGGVPPLFFKPQSYLHY